MSFLHAVQFAHTTIRNHPCKKEIAIDATCGNGHDTAFLCHLIEPTGTVYGFDIQSLALKQTMSKIEQEFKPMPSNLKLFHENHAMMEAVIPFEHQGHIDVIMFNLGYLPGADHQITTSTSTTLLALDASLRLLRKNGLLSIVVYPGHEAGAEESVAIEAWANQLSQQKYQVMRYQFVNLIHSPPYFMGIHKK